MTDSEEMYIQDPITKKGEKREEEEEEEEEEDEGEQKEVGVADCELVFLKGASKTMWDK